MTLQVLLQTTLQFQPTARTKTASRLVPLTRKELGVLAIGRAENGEWFSAAQISARCLMADVGQETILVSVFVAALVICFIAIRGVKFKLALRLNQLSISLN